MRYKIVGLAAALLAFCAFPKNVLRVSPAERLASNASYRYWPVCLYVDKGARTSMKQVAENLVHEANRCGVDLKITPTYVSQVPTDLTALKALSKDRCKAASLKTNPPHPHASVIVVVDPQSPLPGVACNISREQPGCGEWTVPPEKALRQSLESSGNGDASPVAPGEETFSVVRGGALASGAAFQWGVGVALGQLVPGNSLGRGLSFAEEGAYVGSGGSPSDPLLPEACESLRRNAYRRQGVPQPDRSKFLIARDDPSYSLNLVTGKYEGGLKAVANAASGAVLSGSQKANALLKQAAQGAAAALNGINNLGDTFDKGSGAHKKPGRVPAAAPPVNAVQPIRSNSGGASKVKAATNDRPENDPQVQKLPEDRLNLPEAIPKTEGPP